MMTHNSRLSPGRIPHLQLLNAGEKKIQVINAFTPSSSCTSSSSASSSGSNTPSVPTTPESQSNERLSTSTRSQPDLSKLDELEYILTKINVNNNSTHTNYSDGPSGNSVNSNLIQNNQQIISINNNNIQSNSTVGTNGVYNSSAGNYSVYVNRTDTSETGSTASPLKFESHKLNDGGSLYSNAAVIYQHNNSNNYSINRNTHNLNDNNNSMYTTCNTSATYGNRNSNSYLPPPSPSKSHLNKNYNNSEYQNQVELLRMENRSLKVELDSLESKLSRYEKVEDEIQRVLQIHEDFVNSTGKKEILEKRLRFKLTLQVKRLEDENKKLKEQNDALIALAASTTPAAATGILSSSTSNLNHLDSTGADSPCYPADSISGANRDKSSDHLIAQLLVTENEELRAHKENQEIELQAQRLTLAEQRMHIDILNNALSATQSNVALLQAELKKSQLVKQEPI